MTLVQAIERAELKHKLLSHSIFARKMDFHGMCLLYAQLKPKAEKDIEKYGMGCVEYR